MTRLIHLALFALCALFVGLPAAAAPVVPGGSADLPTALLATLEVAPDGTLAFRDSATAQDLLGADWAAALDQFDDLNDRIRGGETPRFGSTADLQTYRLKDPLSCGAAEPGAEQAVDGGSDIESVDSPQADPQANCYCKKGCCLSGICCDAGWWIFCWRYGNC